MLLCFLGQCRSVVSPGEVLCDVHTQELGAAHSLDSRTVAGQRSMLSVHILVHKCKKGVEVLGRSGLESY